MKDKFFISIKEKVLPCFEEAGSHDFSHTERVYNLAVKIAKAEKADLKIIKAAALLHDIARCKEEKGEIKCHAETGAELAEEILKEINFPADKILKVKDCIKVHRYSKNLKANTKEEEILQDADRLDAIGAITIGRIFQYSAKQNRPAHTPNIPPRQVYDTQKSTSAINHFYEKILKITPDTFKTQKAKKIAKKRYDFTKKFVDQFIKEWEGKA